jgi:MYXO-CTERM domain-containing protein
MGLPAGCAADACAPVDCTGQACTAVPIVLNLSLGSDFGSHDGTSNIETGLSAFVGDDKPGRAVVVAAGNSGEIDDPGGGLGPYGIHTEVHVFDGETARVPMIATAPSTSGQLFVWITFKPGDSVSVGLTGPGGSSWVGFTGPGSQASYQDGTAQNADTAGIVNNLPSANAELTSATNSAILEFSGHWDAGSEFAVLLRGSGDASLWLTAEGDAVQSFVFEKALRQGTINVPASAPGLLGVGCTVNRVQWTPLGGTPVVLGELGTDLDPVADSACYFSSNGPTPFGAQKPEISAPGGFVAAAMSHDADPRVNPGGLFDLGGCPSNEPYCAVMDDYHALAAGTSMSAPHAAGAAALLMEIDPTLTQARVTQVLQAGARLSRGHVPDPDQLGPGSLDVDAARLALLSTMAAPTEPDLGQSWYTLSSAYARPDPTWPVWGTVELRLADGTIAGAIDGTKLALTLQGGAVYQPLTRVRPGLWTFAVAGQLTDLGTTLALEITYGGASLGKRTLPVGYDYWSATDPTLSAASGGCTCTTGRGEPALPFFGLPAAALVAAAAMRRAVRRERRERPVRRPGSPSRGG